MYLSHFRKLAFRRITHPLNSHWLTRRPIKEQRPMDNNRENYLLYL